ncbi:MAG: HEPN domain-containing protein [Tepidisphaeraceae bacterium]
MQKAEGDYDVVLLLLRSRKRTRYDPMCFHCQQCVEKYLKARLTESSIAYAKTHDLAALLRLALAVEPMWGVLLSKMNGLSGWAVLPRYPGTTPTAADAKEAVAICRDFRELARDSLGIW